MKATGDWVSAGITVGALLSWLPHLTALVALVWWLIRVYETETAQRLLARLRGK